MLSLLQRSPALAASHKVVHAGALQVERLGKRFGAVTALQALELSVGEGEIVSVTGPSGAGKSTLARLVSGLEIPSEGRVLLSGIDVSTLPPQARRVAHMFESYALFPTLTVAENVASPLQAPTSLGRWSGQQQRERVEEVLALTEISALRDRLPSQLSGGQKQRVALCRALAQDPSVFVLDEPIGHLDAKLRHMLRGEIRRRQTRLRQGTLWLTPDGLEAMAVADRMAVLIDGQLQQVGTPSEVFRQPANVRVARLIGDPAMNVVQAVLSGGSMPQLQVGDAPPAPVSPALFHRLSPGACEGRVLLGLRPADLQVTAFDRPTDAAGADQLPARVYAVEPLGKQTLVTVEVGGQRLRTKAPPEVSWPIGAPVKLVFRLAQVLSFDPASGELHRNPPSCIPSTSQPKAPT